MNIVNGACTHCGCAEHECECAEREKAIRTDKVEEYMLAMAVQMRSGVVRFNRYLCFDCRNHADPFMVHNAIWHSAWPTYRDDKLMLRKRYETMYPEHHEPSHRAGVIKLKKGKGTSALLCLPCLEQRLGKALKIEDFTKDPVNNPIRFAFMMGVDAARHAVRQQHAIAVGTGR